MSITALSEGFRWSILLLPIILSFSQMARAADINSFAETIEYEEIQDDQNQGRVSKAMAHFGPFTVIDAATAEITNATDSDSPAQFRAMLQAYPLINSLHMVECPGTFDDGANLDIARMIRAKRMNTHVPNGGSIRSGGVELFLAGVKRTAHSGAEFGVHSWQDYDGNEARDMPENDPVHREYINYYKDMGLAPNIAREFYAFTNAAAPFDGVHYMTLAELTRFQIIN